VTCALVMSSFDLPTHSASGFLMRYIAPRVEPFQLYGPLARRPMFGLIAPSSDLVVGVGHGEPDEFTAQGESLIWKAGAYNIKETGGKIVKLISCQTGAVLGPDLVQNGTLCFMGYDDDIIWIADSDYWNQPWNDPNAALCLGPIISSLQALLDGQTCAEAFAIEQAGFLENAAASSDFPLLRDCLTFNAAHSIILGDETATVRPRPRISLPPPPPLII
jgi:hypothetical protein